MEKKEYLIESFQKAGIEISEEQANQFLTFADLLVTWNAKMNLTAITEFEDIVWKHFIDSVIICKSKNVSRESFQGNIIDVGCGAGFPGIPLKIYYPDCKLTCLDSLNKRLTFIQEVAKECKLKNIITIHGRAEDYGHDEKYREKYRLCVSRAVANSSTLAEYCLPFVRQGGIFIAYKAGDAKAEIQEAKKAIQVFGGEMVTAEEYVIPYQELSRTFLICKKIQNTPKKYPRKAGTPAKSPIR